VRSPEAPARLFGTDGVRGVAGQYPLDHETIRRLGAALVRALPGGGARARLLVGRDTRESGSWLETELAHGAAGQGASVTSGGVLPTPAVAFLTRTQGFDLGVVISASHNPFEDNGIKVFSGRGEKFTESVEREVEAIVADPSWRPRDGSTAAVAPSDLVEAYLEHLQAVFPNPPRLGRFAIAVDCANGATSLLAPTLFRRLGLDPVVIADAPDGRNINLRCGSTHPEQLAETVLAGGCQFGVAFDGDGDRAIFADHRGRVVDGDAVLLMCARQLLKEGRLRGNAVVATVMSNIGLELALRRLGIELVRCPVGDKYVMEAMRDRDLALGGEQSGHIIFSDYLFTGDGLCTALNVLRVVALTGRTLAELSDDLVTYPQVLLNIRVREKVDWRKISSIQTVVNRVEQRVADTGRVLIRYSGTEPLLRVMIEGEHEEEIRAWAEEIAQAVRNELS
jgi:phosphoglucosamine mutase